MFLSAEGSHREEQLVLGLLNGPRADNFFVANTEYFFDNWGQTLDQTVLLRFVQLRDKFENIKNLLFGIDDVLRIGFVLESEVLENGKAFDRNL